MAQHDYSIANGSGAAVRSDLNNALSAIVSQNSGTTEPTTTYAYMRWADTTAGVMKMRNGANNAWITLYQLDGEWSTIAFENGSASAPSIYFKDSGTDTGIYSPGTDQVAISTGGTGRLFVDSSGRVGLGTSSPSFAAHISSAKNTSQLFIGITGLSSVDDYAQIGLGSGSTPYGLVRLGFDNPAGVTNTYLSFYNNNGSSNVERLRIDSSGRVGIGTTTVSSALHVIGDQIRFSNSSNASFYGTITHDANSTGANIYNSVDSGPGHIFQRNGTEQLRIDASSRLLVGTSSSVSSTALIQAYKPSGELQCVVNSGSLGNAEGVVFTANAGGRLSQFGAYKHSGITNPCSYYYLEQQNGAGQVFWVDDSGNFRLSTSGGNIGTTGGTVVGTQTSDERLKNILGPVTYGLGTLKQIEPVRYTLKSQPDIEQLGFIAQQVQPLVPQSVFDTKEHIEGEPEDAPTKLGMEYVALIPVLVNAVKELSAEVDALKAQLQAL